jgi:ABC-type lipoprotein export system ATPase subunit
LIEMSAESLLSLRGVAKCYWRGPQRVSVLQDVSLEVEAGELVAVWGQRRSGKTTLLKLAAGLEEPSDGTVRFGGRELKRLSPSAYAKVLREEIGWAKPTGPDNRDLRMLDYVALPLRRKHDHRTARRRAALELERVGASACAYELWGGLSDSERALVAIAHAIVREPRLVLVDDHPMNLDDLQREEVMGLLRTTAGEQGTAVLVTVPDVSQMAGAHQIHSLSSGRLVGPPESERSRGNVIALPGIELGRRGGAAG